MVRRGSLPKRSQSFHSVCGPAPGVQQASDNNAVITYKITLAITSSTIHIALHKQLIQATEVLGLTFTKLNIERGMIYLYTKTPVSHGVRDLAKQLCDRISGSMKEIHLELGALTEGSSNVRIT